MQLNELIEKLQVLNERYPSGCKVEVIVEDLQDPDLSEPGIDCELLDIRRSSYTYDSYPIVRLVAKSWYNKPTECVSKDLEDHETV